MTTLKMPKVDRQILKNKDEIIKDICSFTKIDNILSEREELKPYETDGRLFPKGSGWADRFVSDSYVWSSYLGSRYR